MVEKPVGLPLLLLVAMVLGAIFGVLGTTLGLWGLNRLLFGDGQFLVGEGPISQPDLVAVAVPFLALYVLACVTAGAASWALWKGRSRSRIMLTTLLAEFVVGDVAMIALARRLVPASATDLVVAALGFSALVFLGLWYLYRKDSVVSYYAAVRQGGR